MKILALETSGFVADVALLDAGSTGVQPVATKQLPGQPRTAQTLAPAIAELLRELEWQPSSIDLVVVAVGPGSFTGLRLGITTAKVFAYAADAQIHGVNTLTAIASNAAELVESLPNVHRIFSLMDAQRNQLFVASYAADVLRDKNALQAITETCIVDDDAWLNSLTSSDLVIGPGLKQLREPLADLVQQRQIQAAPEHLWQPRAIEVGELAWRDLQAGSSGTDVWNLVPQYYRQSAAEEKLAQPRG